jgi:PRC-barrel domain
MTTKWLLSTALGTALMLSGAMAQTPVTPNPGRGLKPAVTTPANPGKPAAQKPNGNAATRSNTTKAPGIGRNNEASKTVVVASQNPSQWLASKFKGTEVLGADNKKIGTIGDILFDKSGKIDAYVVSFGGFLGMGSKEVAIAPNSFQVMPGTKGGPDKLRLAMSTKGLRHLQKFAAYLPPKRKPSSAAGGAGLAGGGLVTHTPSAPPRMN